MATTESTTDDGSGTEYEHIVLVVANNPSAFDGAKQERVAQALDEACDEEDIELAATEFDDDHVHVYIESGHNHSKRDVVERLKATSQRRYRYSPVFTDTHRWKRGLHDGTVKEIPA